MVWPTTKAEERWHLSNESFEESQCQVFIRQTETGVSGFWLGSEWASLLAFNLCCRKVCGNRGKEHQRIYCPTTWLDPAR